MIRVPVLVCSVLFASVSSEIGLAETVQSVLSAIDTHGRVVRLGDELEGSLSADDLVTVNGDPIQAWVLDVPVDSIVQVDLRSDDFDTYLYVLGPGLNGDIRDDDGGDRYDSRICFIAGNQAGEYRAVVSSADDNVGAFTIAAKSVDGTCPDTNELTDLSTISANGRSIAVGDDIHGSLTDTDATLYGVLPVQAWSVQGSAGHSFSVDLISDVFDGLLVFFGPGIDGELIDDNGAGMCNARISLDFPETGEYKLVVSTLGTVIGSFRLVASEQPGPVNSGPCPGDESLSEIPVEADLIVEQASLGVIRGNERRFHGRPSQVWYFAGIDGDNVALTLTSDQFDTFMYFDGPGFPVPLSDNDSAGDDDSLICVEISETGTYRIYAGAYTTADSGAEYSLRATVLYADSLCENYSRSEAAILDELKEESIDVFEIRPDEEKYGSLTDSVIHPGSGRPIDVWILRADAATLLYVDVVTDDFDAYLYALLDSSDVLIANDYGENSNVRTEIIVPSSGEVTLLVSSNNPQSSGDYTLRVSSTNPEPLEQSIYGRIRVGDSSEIHGIGSPTVVLPVGSEIHGLIDENAYSIPRGFAKAFLYDGSFGEEVVFELVSSDFDSYLYLSGPGIDGVLYDDDGAGRSDSRIEITLPQEGYYTVVVSTWSRGSTGRFKLRTFRIVRQLG